MNKALHAIGAAAVSSLATPFALDVLRLDDSALGEFFVYFGMSALFTIAYTILLFKAHAGSSNRLSLVMSALILALVGYIFSQWAELDIHLRDISYKAALLMHPKWYWWALIIAPLSVISLLRKVRHN